MSLLNIWLWAIGYTHKTFRDLIMSLLNFWSGNPTPRGIGGRRAALRLHAAFGTGLAMRWAHSLASHAAWDSVFSGLVLPAPAAHLRRAEAPCCLWNWFNRGCPTWRGIVLRLHAAFGTGLVRPRCGSMLPFELPMELA